MASQRRKSRSPTTAAPVAGHSSRYLENRRPRFQAPADSNPTRAQYDAGAARSASPLLPTASLGSSVARKNQAAHPLTRRIFLRQKEVKFTAGIEAQTPKDASRQAAPDWICCLYRCAPTVPLT